MTTCEHYERVGALRAERGEADPHGEGCETCRREHAVRRAMIATLPLIDADVVGDPNWQQRVWLSIEREEHSARMARRPLRGSWFFGGAFATVCMVIVIGWVVIHHEPREHGVKISFHTSQPERGASPRRGSVGDWLQIDAGKGSDVRVYHGDKLVRWCSDQSSGDGCRIDGDTLTVEVRLHEAGMYYIVIVQGERGAPWPAPGQAMNLDLRALSNAGGQSQTYDVEVR